MLKSLGRLTEAKECYTQAVHHHERAEYIFNLGNLLEDLKDYTGAKGLYLNALALELADPDGDDSSIAITRANLGEVLNKLGDYSGALDQFKQALELLSNPDSTNYIYIVDIQKSIGDIYAQQGRYNQAKDEYRRPCQIIEKINPENVVGIIKTKFKLAEMLKNFREYEEARQLFSEGLATYKLMDSPNPDLVDKIEKTIETLSEAIERTGKSENGLGIIQEE